VQCVSNSGPTSTENNTGALATSTPRNDTENVPESKKQSSEEIVARSPPNNGTSTDKSPGVGLMTGMNPGTWLVNVPGSAPAIQSKPHLRTSHPYIGIQSPLGVGQAPYSPAMQGLTYPGSVSSCPSVSSSSGCSSASENQDMASTKNYILSEYHVGPHRLISEKDIDNQSEEATTSGRNTPVDPAADDNGNTILPSEHQGAYVVLVGKSMMLCLRDVCFRVLELSAKKSVFPLRVLSCV
jgi:hypothetical protein